MSTIILTHYNKSFIKVCSAIETFLRWIKHLPGEERGFPENNQHFIWTFKKVMRFHKHSGSSPGDKKSQ